MPIFNLSHGACYNNVHHFAIIAPGIAQKWSQTESTSNRRKKLLKYDNLTPGQLVHRLGMAGRHPQPELINTIWKRRSDTEPLLLDVFNEAIDDDWADDDDPRWYRFIHAGKFMLAWQNTGALPTFVRLYSADDERLLDTCEWFEEELLHYGPDIIPHLKPIIGKDSNNKWHYGKGLSGSILTKIATYYPETRDEIRAIFRAQLPPPEDIPSNHDEMWGNWAAELGALADETSRDHIIALADAGVLNRDFFARRSYLREMAQGFTPQDPPPPFDIRAYYEGAYEEEQAHQKWIAQERARKDSQQSQLASPRNTAKVGRNDPCPCGSGKKYKQCHGRPGA